MRAIVEQSNEEIARLNAVSKNLRDHGVTRQNAIVDLQRSSGYAHYNYSGKQSSEVEVMLGRGLTSDEIIILVDGGFSHFGATCAMDGKHFSGRINTD